MSYRRPLGSPFKNYNIRWIFSDVKTVIIAVLVLAVLLAPCIIGNWFYAKKKRKQQIFDSAIEACPPDRKRMMCMRNVEKMHETCYKRSIHPEKPKRRRFDYFGYRSCVGVPVNIQTLDPFQMLKDAY